MSAEDHFHFEMVEGPKRLKREIGYNPIRFNQMVAEQGGVGAAHLLLEGRDASDGFTTLWENGRLRMSVEATVLLPWYEKLFSDEERTTARRRLAEHRFDVDDFIEAKTSNPPAWVKSEDQPG